MNMNMHINIEDKRNNGVQVYQGCKKLKRIWNYSCQAVVVQRSEKGKKIH